MCEACRGDEAPTSGDPVYPFSGELHESVVDLRIPGRGVDFIWARKYRSKIEPATAAGRGWDFSYNIRIEQNGPDLVVHDGNTRRDLYALKPDGTWSRKEFFRKITQNPNGTYTLEFSDTGMWNFNAFDGGGEDGKIAGIVDRNGNTLSFDYDGLGRLVIIHDSLDTAAHNRDITISYNADGFIESVTDFIGRTVLYEYYDGIEPGGGFGDLKSVTTPAVTGTPNDNDFPAGKTTVYTYTTGFADDRLNHNLLTITDPKGQTYVQNEYYSTTDPYDLNFDRIKRKTWGDPGEVSDFVYVDQTARAADSLAVIKTIINDRVGNVEEWFYNEANQRVMLHQYTGRADPDQPTTDIDNRPTGKLRPGIDPDFFVTRWEYNNDSRITRIIHPNGNEEVFTYDTSNPNPRSRGNLLEHCRLPGTHNPPGDQAQICESFEYDDEFGGCCGTNFVTKEVDGRGNETLHEYDANGNRTHTTHRIPSIVEDWEYNTFGQMTAHILPDNGGGHRRRDEYTYYDSGPQLGYQHRRIIDAPNFTLTTTYDYDEVGNVISTTDPRGNDTQYVYNQLDQVVRERSREVTDGSGVRYQRDTFYDANDNVVRIDIQNVDDAGDLVSGNPYFTTIYEYEILDYRTRTCEESGSADVPLAQRDCAGLPTAEFITTEYEYDANRNRTLVRYGEAVNGTDTDNVVGTLYDERDLVFREIRAEGDPDQSTSQYDYDGNSNITRVHEGLEDVPRVTQSTYDGYDRRVASTDPMGNVATYHYDANDNRVSARVDGELVDVSGSAANVRLSETAYLYDAMDRLTQTDVDFFDTLTQTPIDDGKATTQAFYSDNSQVTLVRDDNANETTTTYDTANRQSLVTDAKGNTVAYTYDENSNVTSVTRSEKSDLGDPDEMFTTTQGYDNLDRLIQTTDNVGNTHSYGYDSRDNRTVTVDALNNETRYTYDGINRLTTTTRDLDDDGADGDGDDITTTQAWDDTSRLTAQADDKDNTTRYAYDALDRLIVTQMADGTIRQVGGGAVWVKGQAQPDLAGFTSGYDVHDNRITITDANGSASTSTYDLLDRLISKAIAPGPDVSSDTTSETYQYDGLSRLVSADDDDSTVTRSYDSLSRVTGETLNGETTTSAHDGVGNQLTCTYPGGRVVTHTYDELDRKKTISDGGGTITTYDYVGPGRVERREYGNGTRTDYTYDGITGTPNPANDFGVKRIIGTTHSVIAGGAVIDNRTYTWDRMYNKTQRKDIRGGPRLTHDYTYDDIYRLVHTTVTDGSPPITVRDTDYDLDGVGNRTTVAGAPDPGLYTMDATQPEPADEQMNQYTTTPTECRVYDDNGNLVGKNDSGPCEIPVVPPGLPPNTEHHARKHRYISVDATTNGETEVAIKVEIAEMNRCQGDLRRSCDVDEDCPTVCQADPDIHSCGDGGSCPDGVCIETGPCVPHPNVGLSWYVQEPQTLGASCPNGQCDEEDYYARVDPNPYVSDWKAECEDAHIPGWSGGCSTLHIGDCQIVPGVKYNVYACLEAGDPCSDPLEVETTRRPDGASHFGDVAGGVTPQLVFEPPDGFVSVKDITAYKKAVVNWGTTTLPLPHPTWVDLHGGGTGIPPQYVINVSDLSMILRAWVNAWPYENSIGGLAPGDCPGRGLRDGPGPLYPPEPRAEWNPDLSGARANSPARAVSDVQGATGGLTSSAGGPATADLITYDYRNQMVEFVDGTTGERHTYAYDALGRRIAKVVNAANTANSQFAIRHSPFGPPPSRGLQPARTSDDQASRDREGAVQGEGSIDNRQSTIGNPLETRYFYDGWQVVEEQDVPTPSRGLQPARASTLATYVYGLYIDEVLNMQRGGADYYYHTDDLYNVMAITDAGGIVVERYEYADYGQPIDPSSLSPLAPPSLLGNPYLFTGRRYDPETGWYYYRTRYLDPIVGRFTTRDTIGIWGDRNNLGNGYAYVADGPTTRLDPFGWADIRIDNRGAKCWGLGSGNAWLGQVWCKKTKSGCKLVPVYNDARGKKKYKKCQGAVKDCAIKHEKKHIDQYNADTKTVFCKPCPCKGKGRCLKPTRKSKRKAEKEAHEVERDCLQKYIDKEGEEGDAEKKKCLQKRMKKVKRALPYRSD